MPSQQELTVLVPTRNRPRVTADLVAHLRRELGWTSPVVLVDQSDDGGTALAALLETLPEAVRSGVVHHVDSRRGTGAARNAAAVLAKTPWLLLLDDDVRPTADYLATLGDFLDQRPWLDGAVPGLEQDAAWRAYREDPEGWLGHRRASAPARAQSRDRYPETWDGVQWFTGSPWSGWETPAIGVSSGNLAIRRAAYFGVGGFDERIEGLGDDREFGLRLWWYGYRVATCPEALAFHLRSPAGGTRLAGGRLANLWRPEPDVGWVYLYLKWFPGLPTRRMLAGRLVKALRRPWTVPIKIVRLWRAVAEARRRLDAGPALLSEPVPRAAHPELA